MKNIAVFETADKSTVINLDCVTNVIVQRRPATTPGYEHAPIEITFTLVACSNGTGAHVFHTDEDGAKQILAIAGLSKVRVPTEVK